MSNRKTIDLRPSRPTATVGADKWVENRTIEPIATEEPVKMKPLVINVPEEMHVRLKSECAKRGVKMSDVIRDLINKEFPPNP